MSSANIKYFSRYIIFSISILLVLGSCNTRKFLGENQVLLKENKVTFSTKEKIFKKRSLKYELPTLYKQKPNTKSFRLTKFNLWLWYKTDSLSNPNKFQRWIRKKIAEPPALYNDNISKETAQTMQYYLQNKGYYDAVVRYETKINKKKKLASVEYIVDNKKMYTIDSVFFSAEDPKIQRILNDSENETFLKKGSPVSNEVYGKEVNRITTTLQNLGFAYFDRNYVDKLAGDSTGTKVNLYLNVANPKNQFEHKIYQVGEISVNANFIPAEILKQKKDSIIDGVRYILDEKGTVVNPKSINREIFLKPGTLYRLEDYTKTNRQLGKLDIYKFVSIKPTQDTSDQDVINFEIRLTPRDRMVIGGDIEFNNSNYTFQDNNNSLIGTSLNLNFQNRNFRKNASTLSLQASNGLELNILPDQDLIYSLDILTQADWYIPKFVQFPKIISSLNQVKIINDNYYRDLQEKAETKVSLSYNRLLLFNFYNYHSFNMSFGYDLQRDKSHRYTWNQTGINYLLPRFELPFLEIINNNPFIENSFSEQLFTGFLFRDIKYTYTGKSNLFGSSWKFIGDLELSGGEIFLTNYFANGFNRKSEFLLFDEVEFSQYARLNLDIRRYLSTGKNSMLAYKAAVGIATPYGFSESVPYVKQFYGGGPYGNRAWRIRELGPGGYDIPIEADTFDVFYQTGDLRIDLNIEYRFNIIAGFKGAIFIDGANVWTLEEDPLRPGAQFLLKADPDVPESAPFYKQFGVGIGFGLRYDFSYFVLGLDLGIKARNPYPDAQGRHWLFHEYNNLNIGDVNPNLLIGFPF